MIYDSEWRKTFYRQVMPALYDAHGDLTRIAAALRNSSGVEVWTETPTDSSKVGTGMTAYSLEGWRMFFAAKYTMLNSFISSYGTLLQNYDSQAKTACDGYLASLPAIASTMNTIIANYIDAGNLMQTKISQDDRNTLASAIEGQLQ